jgi:hypothetical protein
LNVEFESAVEREVQHMTEESSVTVGDEGDHARDTLVAEEGGRWGETTIGFREENRKA